MALRNLTITRYGCSLSSLSRHSGVALDRLRAIEIFVRAAESQSFSEAARHLRLSRSMIAAQIGRLEDQLGARLFTRTTRRVGLTEAGRAYLERCQQILADLAEADAAVAGLDSEPRGVLKINAPISFSAAYLTDAVVAFSQGHPKLHVELICNDRMVDLVEEGFDVAIRIARAMPDSRLIATRLAEARSIVCAAPAYLDRRGRPKEPDDLKDHDCLTYSLSRDPGCWELEHEGRRLESVRITGSLTANNGDVLRNAAILGLGIVMQPSFIVGPDIAAGRLEVLMPTWRAPAVGIHAVYLPGRRPSLKVSRLIAFLRQRFGGVPPWERALPG